MIRLPLWLLAGCVVPPDLPHLDALPRSGPEVTPCAPDREAQVIHVVDGDTVDLAPDGERVRFLGVDAPEIAHGGSGAADCWGDESHEEVRRMLDGRQVTLTFDAECAGLFGRTLAYLWLVGDDLDHLRNQPGIDRHLYRLYPGEGGEALLVNQWIVAQGHGRVYPAEIFGRIAYQDHLEQAEAEARAHRRGLWGACGGR